ncbi:M48 family metallopeptidase [Aliishimia ponticola]|uniref:M48 family metallopeptidase n=1 Tax=Aliishimia ponticola TaxID=2499833 RepID=A0A4S4NRR0_9RHOB|nr:M48 family metallopeptidase [Aliishimia ponticola]THH38910.1 M48 family metallopeptidase [Aliishimia ponticola]
MLKLTPILLALAYGLIMYRFSVWRTARELDSQSTVLDDPELGRICDRLAGALDLPRIKVHIYEIAPVNGLAAPDGRIFITRGFYNKFRNGEVSGEEMASVIAHELGHVALGHSRRRMIDFSGQNAMRMALGMVLSRILPGIGIWIANMLTSLLAARLSRSDEFEADAYAAALLTKAGIGVAPQISLFSKLDELTRSKAGPVPAWLMSHPKTDQRIAALKKLEDKWNGAADAT